MNTLYSDSLVELTDEEIIFHEYYFPSRKDKRVPWTQIERIEVRQASLSTGTWRLWGTGDFRTWFPRDYNRPNRDQIFLVFLRGRFRRIGFTAEKSQPVVNILNQRGILKSPGPE